MNGLQNKKPGREYRKVGRTLRRVPIPMKPPVPCIIVDNEGTPLGYDFRQKVIDPNATGAVFPSRTQARKALWHILQSGEFTVYAPFSVVPRTNL